MGLTYQQLQSMGATPGFSTNTNGGNQPSIPSQSSEKGLTADQLSSMGAKPGLSQSQPSPQENQDQSLGGKILGGAKAVGNFLFPVVGDIVNDFKRKSDKTALQQTGDLALSILPFIPGLGEVGEALRGGKLAAEGVEAGADIAKGTGLLSKAGAKTVAKGAGYGYGTGVASNLSQGQSIGQSIKPGLGNITGAVLGGAGSGLIKGLGIGEKSIANSATEDIEKVLSPTTKANKAITQKIAPELAKKGIIASSREGLLEKYQGNMQQAGEALEAGYQKLPDEAKFEVTNLLGNLNKKIDELHINGVVPSASQDKVNALTKMTQDLANIGLTDSPDGQQVFSSVDNVRKLRKILDDTVSNKNFAISDLDNANKMARKELANSIREEFAKQYPDIAKLNRDFSFWAKASGVLEDAISRKTGQTGIVRKGLAAGIGAVGGLSQGHPFLGAATTKLFSDFLESPAFHTASASIKSKIASMIESGDSAGLSRLIKGTVKVTPGLINRGTQSVLGSINQK